MESSPCFPKTGICSSKGLKLLQLLLEFALSRIERCFDVGQMALQRKNQSPFCGIHRITQHHCAREQSVVECIAQWTSVQYLGNKLPGHRALTFKNSNAGPATAITFIKLFILYRSIQCSSKKESISHLYPAPHTDGMSAEVITAKWPAHNVNEQSNAYCVGHFTNRSAYLWFRRTMTISHNMILE